MILRWNIQIRLRKANVPPLQQPITNTTTNSNKDFIVSHKKHRGMNPRENRPQQWTSNKTLVYILPSTKDDSAKNTKVPPSTTTSYFYQSNTTTHNKLIDKENRMCHKQWNTAEQIRYMAALTCKYNIVGCYNINCIYCHQSTYTLPCKYSPCQAPGKCKLNTNQDNKRHQPNLKYPGRKCVKPKKDLKKNISKV